MKLGDSALTKTNYQGEIRNFSIRQSPIAFEILSSRLYQDSSMAIIREIVSNAWESHVARYDKNAYQHPIDITLPTIQDPEWRIRDYGTGLSKDDINNLYTVFFASTKNDTNDFTGCFGLGSKTPFSYTKMFKVNSFFAGNKAEYLCVVKDGYPSVTMIKDSPTNEDSGIEISIPIQGSDYKKFSDNTFKYIDTVPEVNVNITNQNLNHVRKDPFISIDCKYPIKIFSVTDSSILCEPIRIKQGINVYPIKDFIYENRFFRNFTDSHTVCIQIEVPIGTFDVTPSRESITDNNTNRERLENILNLSETSIANYLKKRIDGVIFNEDRKDETIILINRWLQYEINRITNYFYISTRYSGLSIVPSYTEKRFERITPVRIPNCETTVRNIFSRIKTYVILRKSKSESTNKRIKDKILASIGNRKDIQVLIYNVNEKNTFPSVFIRLKKFLNSIPELGFDINVISLPAFYKIFPKKNSINNIYKSEFSDDTSIMYRGVIRIKKAFKNNRVLSASATLGGISDSFPPETTLIISDKNQSVMSTTIFGWSFNIEYANIILSLAYPDKENAIVISEKYRSYFIGKSYDVVTLKDILKKVFESERKFYIFRTDPKISVWVTNKIMEGLKKSLSKREFNAIRKTKTYEALEKIESLIESGKGVFSSFSFENSIFENMKEILGEKEFNRHFFFYHSVGIIEKALRAISCYKCRERYNSQSETYYVKSKDRANILQHFLGGGVNAVFSGQE